MLKKMKKFLIEDEEITKGIENLPKETGTMGFDPWGYNKKTSAQIVSLTRFAYHKYFRVKASGLENIPAKGRVLLISNHSGQLPLDGIFIGYALLTNKKNPRSVRVMIERFFPKIPFIGNALNSLGAVVGDPINCERMLQREEAILVFPEGIRGSGKPYSKKYQLQRFGHGFIHLAVKNNTPIVPIGVVGCEETIPSLGNLKTLANMLGAPYIPLSLPAVLPAKISLHIGKLMTIDCDLANEHEVKHEVERVKDAIRRLLEEGLQEREGVYL